VSSTAGLDVGVDRKITLYSVVPNIYFYFILILCFLIVCIFVRKFLCVQKIKNIIVLSTCNMWQKIDKVNGSILGRYKMLK